MDILDPIIQRLKTLIQVGHHYSEHTLITRLAEEQYEPFATLDLKHSRNLFSAHFLIRHCLYRLQDTYRKEPQNNHLTLHISALGVQLFSKDNEADPSPIKKVSAEASPAELRDYYLDIRHYFETTEEDVEQLLNSFWQRYLSKDDTAKALASLGLEPGASYEEVKTSYRHLAQQHHPDKGGDAKTFAEISAAKRLLKHVLI